MLVALWAVAPGVRVPAAADVSRRSRTPSFFSTTLLERRPPFDFVDLYIPSNPFHSLANNVVPAVVLFSVIVGVALIGVERKPVLLDVLDVVSAALSRATRFVVRLTPYGLFAIAAHRRRDAEPRATRPAAGLPDRLRRIALLVSLWVLPGLVAALTPIPMREIFALNRNALITAFVAGDLFIVLPVLIESSRTLLERHGRRRQRRPARRDRAGLVQFPAHRQAPVDQLRALRGVVRRRRRAARRLSAAGAHRPA